jgi:hypothetical protein
MTDWRTRLREAFGNTTVEDADDDKLSRDAALAMRGVVVAAVTADGEAPFSWRNPLAVGAALALMVASGMVAGLRMPVSVDEPGVTIPHTQDAGERRQVQFATPGGTRIVWTIDPEFRLNEVIP